MEDGSKQVLPYSYATNGERQEWRWLGISTPRPLYNLDLISKHPKASIIIAEGEKTADAIQAHYEPNKTVVTAWIGGAHGVKNAEWSPMEGRKVVYWPDNDISQKYGETHKKAGEIKPWNEQPGNEAMLEIHKIIESKIKSSAWVKVPKKFPNKWDAADKEDWKFREIQKFVLDNSIDVPTPPGAKKIELKTAPKSTKPKKASPKNPKLPTKAQSPFGSENEHFRMLGYDKDENSRLVYYFFSYDAKSVIKLSPTNMNKSNLMMLAPINYWEDRFPSNRKMDIDAAQQFLMSKSHQLGPFREKYIRGRGAWMDEDRLVVHTGERLLVGRKEVPLKDFKSRYVYEVGEDLGIAFNKPLKAKAANALIEKIKWLKWEREINAYLVAGWCVIAPFCGILDWRPHIWITGPAGSGKSWVLDHIIKQLVGDVGIVVQGKTTEAGVRGLLQSDARPVLFDESDVESFSDKERIQSILALARSSSYKDGGVIGKGTQTGAARTYKIRSCFAFSSIGVQLNQQSDRSRFTMLGLMSFESFRTKEDFANFEKDWRSEIDDDYVKALQSRTMSLLPTIMKNARTFSDAAAHVIGNRRIGDQVGYMLAGAYSLGKTSEITYDDAVDWVKDKDWTEEKGLELTKDEHQLFAIIMGYVLKTDAEYGTIERSIGELILIAAGLLDEIKLDRIPAAARLRRQGIMVKDNLIIISNTAPGIKVIVKNTSWGSNHNKILERLPNAVKVSPRTFYPGLQSRGVGLPFT